MEIPMNPTIKAIMQSIKINTVLWAEVNEGEEDGDSKDAGYVEYGDHHDGSWADTHESQIILQKLT